MEAGIESIRQNGPMASNALAGEGPLSQLKRALFNELGAPELLPYEGNIIEHCLNTVDSRDFQMNIATADEKMIVEIYRMDTERVKYYLQLYLRTRLFKIEKYYLSLLKNAEMTNRLSQAETQYAKKYRAMIDDHFKKSFLDELPEKLRSTEETKADVNMIPEPNLKVNVFCKILEDIGEVVIDAQQNLSADLRENNIYILTYETIRPFVLSGKIQLFVPAVGTHIRNALLNHLPALSTKIN